MKTTVEISEAVLRPAKELARSQNVTLRELIEAGLRHEVEERSLQRAKPRFSLRDASFAGNGLRRELANATWEQIRDAAYEGRGA